MVAENPNSLPDVRFRPIVAKATRRTTVGQLLDWAREEPELFRSAGVLSDVVVQDEFTHDVVVKLRGGAVLVYDST